MIEFLNQQWWLAIILQAFLWVADHYMTVIGAKLHQSIAAEHFVFQNGYELNPVFEQNVAKFKWFTRKHFAFLLMGCISLSLVRWMFGTPWFEFFIGACILQWLYTDLGHIQNIIYYQNMKKPNSIIGRVETTYWLSQRSAAMSNLSQAVLFGVAALATLRPFFWGGVIACLLQSIRHYGLANRRLPQRGDATAMADGN